MPLPYLDRVVIGGWQFAQGHGRDVEDGAAVLEAYLAAGFRAFDAADIYTGVEALLGEVVAAHGLQREAHLHTKLVPDLASLPRLTADDVARAVDRSLARLRVDALDLVQFHWWDLAVPGYLEALTALDAQRRAGKVRAIGLTNFDAARLAEILDHGIPVASMQAQVSLLDRRACGAYAALAQGRGVDLLAYGSVAGGLLSDAWLDRPAPSGTPENRSLTKYLAIVEETGGWPALQALLRELRSVADERGSDVATVASAWCLRQPGVRACIVGVRSRRHLARHLELRHVLDLDDAELARLERVRSAFPEVAGGVYELERDREGPHGRVMKYGLNEAVSGRRGFRLYDLRVEIVAVEPGMESICNHRIGDCFEVSGENLSIPAGRTFSMYALAAVLPLLPAKQRVTDDNDWMSHDDLVACPDPQCKALMRIVRTGVREFELDEVTATQRR